MDVLGSHPVVEIRCVETDALNTGRCIDGHDEHLTPLDGIGQVGIRFDERQPFNHSTTIAHGERGHREDRD